MSALLAFLPDLVGQRIFGHRSQMRWILVAVGVFEIFRHLGRLGKDAGVDIHLHEENRILYEENRILDLVLIRKLLRSSLASLPRVRISLNSLCLFRTVRFSWNSEPSRLPTFSISGSLSIIYTCPRLVAGIFVQFSWIQFVHLVVSFGKLWIKFNLYSMTRKISPSI